MADPGPSDGTRDSMSDGTSVDPKPVADTDDGLPGSDQSPGERPLGADEPSAPVDIPPDRPKPGPGPDVPPGDPRGPDLEA